MKNKKMSKRKKIIVAIIAALSLLSIIIYAICTQSSLTWLNISSREDDFKQLINEYTSIAELYYGDLKKYDAKELLYLVPDDHNDKYTWCITEEYRHSIELSEDQLEKYNKIINSYYLDKHSLEYICVYDGFVSFCNDGSRASYVYSVEGKKPEYITSPDRPYKDICVKKLSEHWYWICKRK